jgi:uncharacterized protein YndB with AHSA1/START domain
MVDILHRVGIEAPVARVYAALAALDGIAGWWTRETTGVPAPGGSIDLAFSAPDGRHVGGMQMHVVALEPGETVHWRFDAGPDVRIGNWH